ncbi:MAG: hypothetical protein SGJ09_15750 [Phycisphaerae bacterium]|nr:hypothetical protein [Phycisphaerae bacterium]MDZ4831639.1 hypothetical protein [Phycisphaerae bacterium]
MSTRLTKGDFARPVRDLVDVHYRQAGRTTMARQTIGRRIADQPTLRKCATTRESDRNWRFTRID